MVKNAHIRFTSNVPKIQQAGISVQFMGDERHLGRLASYAGSCPEEKIINAFLRQGPEIFRELVHDFLLVLYSTDCTYLVRDRFGVQSLYFVQEGNALHYSPNLRDLRTNEGLSAAQVWAYFHPSTVSEPEVSSTTFYEGIAQVPPSHYYFQYADGRRGFVPYYAPRPDYSVEEPSRAFRERLHEAVSRCTAQAGVVGTHLSGGLDSSSVTMMYAAQHPEPFSTFYFDIGETCQRDPYFAHLVSEKVNSKHHYVCPGTGSVFEQTLAQSGRCGFPEMFVLPSSVHAGIARSARQQGVDMLLTGMDGDAVVGHGYAYLSTLRSKNEWEILVEEITAIRLKRKGGQVPPFGKAQQQVVAEELKALLKQKEARRFVSLFALAKKRWGYTPYQFINYLASEWSKRYAYSSLLKMAEPGTSGASFGVLYTHSDQEIVENFRAVVNADYPYYFEQFRHIGEQEGVAFAHPFFDQELFELCLAVPDQVRFGGGETRSLLRKAMADLLPPELLSRQDKDEFSPFLYRSCIYLWTAHQDFFHAQSRLWEWVDLQGFLRQMQILRSLSPYDVRSRMLARHLSKVLYFGCWLSSN